MPGLRLAELVEATGGELLRGDPQTLADSYVIDTRRLQPGGVFFALHGTRTDGHKFLAEAAEHKAAAAVIEREPGTGQPAPEGLIRVDSTEAALSRCGAWVRRHKKNLKWIAVTGSNGKTTTKELLAEGLSAQSRVHRTPGNLNNHLGVPLSLLACPDDAEVAVLELAMSGPGEIAALARLTDPDIGLVTNVRAAHMQAFSSLDDIAAAKGELFATLRPEATAVVNLDDMHVRVQAARHAGDRVTFGRNQDADLRLEGVRAAFVPGAALSFRHRDRQYRVQLSIGGGHAAFNALAALAGVVAAGGDLDAAIPRVERLQAGPGRGRAHRLDDDVVLIDDSYNSSPAALSSVLETLRLSEPPGRRVLVMGDMLELGPLQGALHREAGRRAANAGVQLLVTVGKEARASADEALHAGIPAVHHFQNSSDAAEAIRGLLQAGDLVVVKGSRGVHLGRVVRALVEKVGEQR